MRKRNAKKAAKNAQKWLHANCKLVEITLEQVRHTSKKINSGSKTPEILGKLVKIDPVIQDSRRPGSGCALKESQGEAV